MRRQLSTRIGFGTAPELLRHLEPEAGLEPATTRLGGDNPILRPVEIVLNGSGTDKKRGGCRAGLRWPDTPEFYRYIALATHAGRARGEQRSVRCAMNSAGNAVLFQA